MLLAIELKPFTSSLSCLNPQCTNLLVALGISLSLNSVNVRCDRIV